MLNNGFHDSATVAPADDPATPALRRDLARTLLIGAIRHYEKALTTMRAVDASYPRLNEPRCPHDDATKAEHRAWQRLIEQADDDFDHAELALASRIQSLYDDLAPEHRRVGSGPHDHFIERAVRFEGTTYALQYNPGGYESGSNIVAVARDAVSFHLESDDDGR